MKALETEAPRGARALFRWMRPKDIEREAFTRALSILGGDSVEQTLGGMKVGCGIEGLSSERNEPIAMTMLEWRYRFVPKAVASLDGEQQRDPRCVWTGTGDGEQTVIYQGYQPDHPEAKSFYIAQVPCPLGMRIRVNDGAPPAKTPSIKLMKPAAGPASAGVITSAKPAAPSHWWECDPTEFQRTIARGEQAINAISIAAQSAEWSRPDATRLDLTSGLPRELWIDWLMSRLRPEDGETKTALRAELRRAKLVALMAGRSDRRGPIEVGCHLERNGVFRQVGWFRSTDITEGWAKSVEEATREHHRHLRRVAERGSAAR